MVRTARAGAERLDAVGILGAADPSVVAFADGDQFLGFIRENRSGVAGVFTDVGRATDTSGLEIARLVIEKSLARPS